MRLRATKIQRLIPLHEPVFSLLRASNCLSPELASRKEFLEGTTQDPLSRLPCFLEGVFSLFLVSLRLIVLGPRQRDRTRARASW